MRIWKRLSTRASNATSPFLHTTNSKTPPQSNSIIERLLPGLSTANSKGIKAATPAKSNMARTSTASAIHTLRRLSRSGSNPNISLIISRTAYKRKSPETNTQGFVQTLAGDPLGGLFRANLSP